MHFHSGEFSAVKMRLAMTWDFCYTFLPIMEMKAPNFLIREVPIYGDALLAPMDGYSDWPFRSLCRELGSAMSYTEFVKVEKILSRSKQPQAKLHYEEGERPVTFQIYGDDPDTILEAALRVQEWKPDIIDVNMGCPAKSISDRGAGVGMMRTPLKIARTFRKLTSAPARSRHRQDPAGLGGEQELPADRADRGGERRLADRHPRADEGAELQR